ncbi:MAG: CBS domain-containing protein [Saprospiraceae bacterium]|nr:CBS domain-containing protein [Saprospiraceae bacterium]
MKITEPISTILTTNCTIVESVADIHTIREIFDYFPNQFLPVVEGLQFIGVILREEFLKQYAFSGDNSLIAKDMVSKEMVKLSPRNILSEAKEIFDTKVFDVIPVVDEDGDLVGLVLRQDVEQFYSELAAAGMRPVDPISNWRKILSFLSF